MDLNYYRTFITVADDCPAAGAVVPAPKGGKKTIAVLQYEMISENPFTLTQEDVLFNTWFARQDLPATLSDTELAELRAQFFAQSRACLRASPLPKTYGWGLRFDEEGRVGLVPMGSDEYHRLASGTDPEVKILKAMRSRRAQLS